MPCTEYNSGYMYVYKGLDQNCSEPNWTVFCLHRTVLEPVWNGSKIGPTEKEFQFWMRSGLVPKQSHVNRRPIRFDFWTRSKRIPCKHSLSEFLNCTDVCKVVLTIFLYNQYTNFIGMYNLHTTIPTTVKIRFGLLSNNFTTEIESAYFFICIHSISGFYIKIDISSLCLSEPCTHTRHITEGKYLFLKLHS